MGDRSEQCGRVRPIFRSFEENSRSDLTKRIGKMGRSPTGAVDQSQVRQPPRRGVYCEQLGYKNPVRCNPLHSIHTPISYGCEFPSPPHSNQRR